MPDTATIAPVTAATTAASPLPSELPTGTVTFLLTDVQGSTTLWEQHPEQMARALVRHDALVEEHTMHHDGAVVKPRGEGDSQFCVFARATDAISAAASIQRAFFHEPWPAPVVVRVRMALHVGDAHLREGDYYGTTVNRCARLRAVAHGGQTLLSAAVHELVRDSLPGGVGLRDMGEHRLKDLLRPERVFQLSVDGVPGEFPPPRGLDERPHNLPIQATPLIGREREVASIREHLLREGVRLLTLIGPGGCGKTRLALQVGADVVDDFPDGVYFVPLAGVRDDALVLPEIARALGVSETATAPLALTLADYLRDRRLLLVLDNFEQVMGAAVQVATLLGACPALETLVTSRAGLRVYGERAFLVEPLSLPDRRRLPALERVRQYEAVRLFVERAQAVKPDFAITSENAPAVAEICHRLDGLPLAIELAAARVRTLAPQALLPRLERSLALLTGGARDLPARQQTLRAAIAWSYDLLGPGERALFRRLAIFEGGCTLPAVEAVCTARGAWDADGSASAETEEIDVLDSVQSLVDESLVRRESADEAEPRFSMLETIREYGRDLLRSEGELEEARRRHAAYYVAFAEEADARLRAPASGASHLWRLDAEHDNLRQALRWTLDEGDAAMGYRLVRALVRYWHRRGHFTEARRYLAELLALPAAAPRSEQRANALVSASAFAGAQGEHAMGRAYRDEAIAIAREVGPRAVLVRQLPYHAYHLAGDGDFDAARRALEEAIALSEELEDRHAVGHRLIDLLKVMSGAGDHAAVAELGERSLRHFREMDNPGGIGRAYGALGDAARRSGDATSAAAHWRRAAETFDARGHAGARAEMEHRLARLAGEEGDLAAARGLLGRALAVYQEHGDRPSVARALRDAAALAAAAGDHARALRFAGAGAAIDAALGMRRDETETAELESWRATARAQLGADAADALWAEGVAAPLDDAVRAALEWLDPERAKAATGGEGQPS